ncbi:MAG: PEGA domain-containing protein [Spirochaetota bacterium]
MSIARVLIIACSCSSLLVPFAGKPEPLQETVKLYHTVPPAVTVELFTFSNRTGDRNYRYLGATLPEQIAEQIEMMREFVIHSNDLILYTNNLNRILIPVVTTNSNHVLTTNFVTNKAILAVDGESNPELVLLETNETIVPFQGRRIIIRGNNGFVRRVSVYGKLLSSPAGMNPEDVAAKRGADVFIYGDIAKNGYQLELSATVLRRVSRIAHTVRMVVDDSDIDEILPLFCYEVAIRLSAREKTTNVVITAEPREAMCYLDGVYLGKVEDGITLSTVTLGKHHIVMKLDGYRAVDKNIVFRTSEQATRLSFTLEPSRSVGAVAVTTPLTNARVYIDGYFRGEGTSISADIPFGSHAMKVIAPGYRDYHAAFSIASTNRRAFTVRPVPIPVADSVAEFFFNWERNTYLFFGSAAALGACAVGAYIYSQERFDFASTYVQNHSLPAASVQSMPEYRDSQFWNSVAIGVGVGAGVAALIGSVSYVIWITSYDFPVYDLAYVPRPDGGGIRVSLRF